MAVDAAAFSGKYLSLSSTRRDGTAVATPVWFVVRDGQLLVVTDAGSGKVKRIRARPRVSVAPCSVRGAPHGAAVPARAEILGPDALAAVEALMQQKYRRDMKILGPLRRIQQSLHLGRARGPTVAIAITPD